MSDPQNTYSTSDLVDHEVELNWVDRETELRKAAEFIRAIETRIADHYLLNFFAPPGYGKTNLLHEMWARHERSLPASLVDVGTYLREDAAFDLQRLLADIVCQLDERLPKRLTSSLALEFGTANEEKLREQLLQLVDVAATYGKIVLLLLDGYDSLPKEPRSWFEANILGPAIKTQQVAVVLTSEAELRFTDRIDLRMRLETQEISSFTEQTITLSFPRYKDLASEILRLTGGLPVCTENLLRYLDEQGISTRAEFRTRERELVDRCYHAYVEQTVFHGLDQALRDTIPVLGLLRRFDVAVLGELLPKILPSYYEGHTKVDYFDLIDRLGNRIQWRKQGGYTLDPGLRMMIEAYTLTQAPKVYEQVNRAALALYRKELDTEYREHRLLELLYHTLALLKLRRDTTPVALETELDEELQRCLNGVGALRPEDLDSLRNSLRLDPDLKDYVSEDALLAIQNRMKQDTDLNV